MKSNRQVFLFILISIWGALTIALAVWWTYFGLQQIALLESLLQNQSIVSKQRMWLWEGMSLIGLIAIGMAGLLGLVIRERSRSQLLRQFYATVTHDVKTSISAIRLKAESLSNKLADGPKKLADRLTEDSVKLELQMENALVLASESDWSLHIEAVGLKELISSLEFQWPKMELSMNCEYEGEVLADYRALRGILSNLLHNAFSHGQASEVHITQSKVDQFIHVQVTDNGSGLKGHLDISQPTPRSGASGLGLFLAKKMSIKMGGDLSILSSTDGFTVLIKLRPA